MRRAALGALCLVALVLPLGAHGPRRPGPPAAQRRRESPAGRAPQAARPNVCGEACCPGWSLALKTGKCTKAVCTPRCRNGGQCKAPQRCACRPGFGGPRCEHSEPAPTSGPPPWPSVAVRWQPLT